MINQIDWDKANRNEDYLAIQIAKRALNIAGLQNNSLMSIQMDIIATHVSGCPLRLKELLESKISDFTHDIFGIMSNINRETGKLENCFRPRYAG